MLMANVTGTWCSLKDLRGPDLLIREMKETTFRLLFSLLLCTGDKNEYMWLKVS